MVRFPCDGRRPARRLISLNEFDAVWDGFLESLTGEADVIGATAYEDKQAKAMNSPVHGEHKQE